MSLSHSHPITPSSTTSSTSVLLTDASNEKKKMDNTALCLEGSKERIKKMFNKVSLSVSSYDTALVAMIPCVNSPQTPFFPECVNWLLNNQHSDGSWSLPNYRHPSLLKDSLQSTLACVLALKQWDIGQQQTNRGLQFIESSIASASDEKQHSPIGFDIIFPSLIESAQSLGINLSLGATSLEAMIHKREMELTRCYESDSEGSKAYLAYVSEGMRTCQDWKMVMKFQRKNGSLFNSPATTAAVFSNLKNDGCLNYLRSALEKFGNAVPTVYPLDIHARLCMIDSLESLGIDYHFSKEIQSALDEIHRYWLHGVEDIFLDPTTCAMAFRILRVNGYDVSSDPFYRYSEDEFSNSLKGYLKDVGAVLELYKASQIMIHPDEEVLLRQNEWTRRFLKQELSPNQVYVDKSCSIEHEVNFELKFPYHARLERVLNRRSIDHYDVQETRVLKTSYRSCNLANREFLKLAAEDFNICQSVHREELKQLERWMVDSKLDKLELLPRMRFAYCYFTGAATLYHRELSEARISWAKNAVLTTVVDDFFDYRGSHEELLQLMQLFEKWDDVDLSTISCSETVEILFSAVRSTVCETVERSLKRQEHDVKDHVIKSWMDTIHGMMKEAEWSKTKYVPTMEEYMESGGPSFALGPIVLPTLYLVGPKFPNDIEKSHEYNRLSELMNICGRLLNDINTYKKESTQGKLNAVSLRVIHSDGCVSVEEAIEEIKVILKEKTRELLSLVLQEKGSIVPRACKQVFWKMVKIVHLFYMKDDGYSSYELMSFVSEVIENAVVIHDFSQDDDAK